MNDLFGIQGHYNDRLVQLCGRRIALWDVLGSSMRPGSLDARIDLGSAVANDFVSFLRSHPDVRLIAFNGRKAEQLFKRLVDLAALGRDVEQAGLPSTSPAYAAMPYSGKVERWRCIMVSASDTSSSGRRQ